MSIQLNSTVRTRSLSERRLERISKASSSKEASVMGFVDRIVDMLNGGKKRRACELLWNITHCQCEQVVEISSPIHYQKHHVVNNPVPDMNKVMSDWLELKNLISTSCRANLRFEVFPVKVGNSCSEDGLTSDCTAYDEFSTSLMFQFRLVLGVDESVSKEHFVSLNCFVVELDAADTLNRILDENDEVGDQIKEIESQIELAKAWYREPKKDIANEKASLPCTKASLENQSTAQAQKKRDEDESAVSENNAIEFYVEVLGKDWESRQTSETFTSEDEDVGYSDFQYSGLLSREEYDICLEKYPDFKSHPEYFTAMNMTEITAYFKSRTQRGTELVDAVDKRSSKAEELAKEAKLQQLKLETEDNVISQQWNLKVREYIGELEEAKLHLCAADKPLNWHHKDFLLDGETTERHYLENANMVAEPADEQTTKINIHTVAESVDPQAKLIMEQFDRCYQTVETRKVQSKGTSKVVEHDEAVDFEEYANGVSSLANALSPSQRCAIHPLTHV